MQLQTVMQERFSNVDLQSLDPQFKYNIYRCEGRGCGCVVLGGGTGREGTVD